MTKKKESNLPMYFLSLSLENVKCFGSKQTLDLSNGKGAPARWTLILGDNGVGKTTLLQLLALMRPTEDPDPDMKKSRKVAIKATIDNFEDNDEYERLFRAGKNEALSVKIELSNGEQLNVTPSKKTSKLVYEIQAESANGELTKSLNIPGYLAEFNEPNIFAYSASRHMVRNNSDQSNLKDPILNLFSETGDLYDAEEILTNLHYKKLADFSRAGKDLITVKALLVDLLPFVENAECIEIMGPSTITTFNTKGGIKIKMPTGKVDFSSLSMGYTTMLAWAVDLAIRMLEKFPDSTAPLEEPAVVIIDEIDLHLHPKWQRDIRKQLTSHFPNTQFICTAHSPLMAQASEEENIVVLKPENEEVHIINNRDLIRGWRVDQILTSELFGVTSTRSIEVEALVNDRRSILDKQKKTKKDREELNRLDEKLSELPTLESKEDEKMMKLIRDAYQVIKTSNR